MEMIPHRRARINNAIAELFCPLMAWNPKHAYMGEKAKMRKMGIAEKTGDMPIYYGVRRSHNGRIYETEVDFPDKDARNPAPDADDRWTELPEYPRPDLLPGEMADNSLFAFKTVQKQYAHWTSLKKQGAIPALMLMTADNRSKPDSDAVGFIDERYPVSLIAVLEETRESPKSIIDQAADVEYSIDLLLNRNPSLGVAGVLPEETKIENARNSEEAFFPVLIMKFRLMVVHRYHYTSSV